MFIGKAAQDSRVNEIDEGKAHSSSMSHIQN